MIEFYKMSGSGNDFILIDNRDGSLAVGDVVAFVKKVCARKVSVGADGLIIVEQSDRVDFRWRFFNADGSEVEMCGNGGRCAARFAFLKGIAGEKVSFETVAGIIDAEVRGDVVKLRLTDPRALVLDDRIRIKNETLFVHSINTGVPHVVHFVRDPDDFDVFGTGRAIRYHEHYRPAGTNANFAAVADMHTLRVRTYERGVEDETLACGTGSVASALIAARKGLVESPVDVRVQSGETLRIHFEMTRDGFTKVYLEGKVRVIYQGLLWDEAWKSM
ncbi:MAG: diaminopimelate epimerase [Proteobacteria bacterium]|nr:diaminopimelate epimerase [Pseudomonadota bacterium]MBU2262741.1 diaminopimelate epimerase [Pseudomonadota bacterium]